MTNNKLILASASPRRLDLLSSLGLTFDVIASDIEEIVEDGHHPRQTVLNLAEQKAQAVADRLDKNTSYVILGSDTIVVIDEKVLGKPNDDNHARQMLAKLSGRTHEVYTGVAIVSLPSRKVLTGYKVSKVTFKKLQDSEIEALVLSKETMDKAGAYALQGMAAAFIEHIDGCFTNVIGLPLTLTTDLLRQSGVPVFGMSK